MYRIILIIAKYLSAGYLFLLSILFSTQIIATELIVVTEDLPPLQIQKDNGGRIRTRTLGTTYFNKNLMIISQIIYQKILSHKSKDYFITKNT